MVVLVREEDILVGPIYLEQGIQEIANIIFHPTRYHWVKGKQIDADSQRNPSCSRLAMILIFPELHNMQLIMRPIYQVPYIEEEHLTCPLNSAEPSQKP